MARKVTILKSQGGVKIEKVEVNGHTLFNVMYANVASVPARNKQHAHELFDAMLAERGKIHDAVMGAK